MERDANLIEAGDFRKYENGFLRRGKEDIGRGRWTEGVAPVSSKPQTPKAPIAYWRDHQLRGGEVEKGKGNLPNVLTRKELIQKEVIRKAAGEKGRIPKGRGSKGKDAG